MPALMPDRSTELRHLAHNVPGCTYDAVVATLHVPTGKRSNRAMKFLSRPHMLELLDLWNGQQPGTWVYWSTTEAADAA